jgi:hypothetical protein
MVLTVSFVISSVTGLSCHRHRRNTFRQLDASVGASGPHDFAVRFRAARLAAPKRPPHPAPTFVTMANAPHGGGTGRMMAVIWVNREAKYFLRRDWTANCGPSPSGKSVAEQ